MSRPTKFSDALIKKLDAIADDGLTLAEVCAKLDIGITTWRRWEADDEHEVFRSMAVRVRAGMGSATDEMAWGVLREIADDVEARASDRLAAAQAILRLRTPHRVELTGKDGGALRVGPALDLSRLSVEKQRLMLELAAEAEGGTP